ncbi:MAG TPA: phospholipid carrier-dependent glycosyltransferase [Anaerolineaceae bacterium]|nr:phospholipid carrier-dependent glycosyltransferase [Anaerolineaceae bacterium]
MSSALISGPQKNTAAKIADLLLGALLLMMITVGIAFRFNWLRWNQGTNLHPDEYGLTNTLTQLQMPESPADYFNTRISPISPYQKYDINGNPTVPGPDNRMQWGQWPIILIRSAGELTGELGYDSIRILGRRLSALADSLALLFIFLTGWRLFDSKKIGLIAAALSSLAVLQIQQSHFMTVDNFGVLFSSMAMTACACIARSPAQWRAVPHRLPNPANWFWLGIFGVSAGMAVASKINLLLVVGMVLVAILVSIADLKLRSLEDLDRILGIAAVQVLFAVLLTALTFRLAQPMSFRAPVGDTTILTLTPNPDWVESVRVASNGSNLIGAGPPAEQWAQRTRVVYPLMNMVVWGMGAPLGLACWVGVILAIVLLARGKADWRVHLLPLVWVLGYFGFMSTRWVMSVRYFLPIYPFLCLYAAFLVEQLLRASRLVFEPGRRIPLIRIAAPVLSVILIAAIFLGDFAWAFAFTRAVYALEHTRIQASRWILHNIPAPFMLTVQIGDSTTGEPVSAPDGLVINAALPYQAPFTPMTGGLLTGVVIPHAATISGETALLDVQVSTDPGGQTVLASTKVAIVDSPNPAGEEIEGIFSIPARIEAGRTYYLHATSSGIQPIRISRTFLTVEDWDEGLPLAIEGKDPFGQLYRGAIMYVRWNDDINKREMFLANLDQADYVIVPSQRSVWANCRLPLTHPLTIEYYRALFDGRLGFDLVALFHSPFKLGPLEISDLAGTAAWNQKPTLPVFNHNFFAAEEAFSVYDHPPVWIFKKRPDFSLVAARNILSSVDLSKVVVQSPRDATGAPCQ